MARTREATASLPAERLSSALRTGLRHAANNRLLWATLARTIAIYPFTAAYWGLLPLIARRTGQGAEHYGLLLSAISAGAVLGSLGHEKLRASSAPDRLIAAGTIVTAVALVMFAFAHDLGIALGAALVAGVAWVNNLTCLYTSAQNVLPDWVRGRGLAVFLTVIYGTMTLCSAAWGEIAAKTELPTALLIAAGGALAALPLTWRWKLQQGASLDLSPSQHWSMPQTYAEIDNDRGPVLVKIEYRIDPKDRVAFLRALDELGFERRRDGAFAWGIFEDAGDEGRYEETYLIESWLELMHLRERVTNADRVLEDQIREMLIAPPRIEFLIAAERGRRVRPRAPSRPEREALRILVVFAHPLETSFVSALHARVVEILRAGGHIVDDLDLYAEKFDPGHAARDAPPLCRYERQHARGRSLRRAPPRGRGARSGVSGVVRRPAGDHAGLFPARVPARRLGPHRRGRALPPQLEEHQAHGRGLRLWRSRRDVAAKGDPARRFVRDNIGALIDPKGRFEYLALYDMNFTAAPRRAAFLEARDARVRGVVNGRTARSRRSRLKAIFEPGERPVHPCLIAEIAERSVDVPLVGVKGAIAERRRDHGVQLYPTEPSTWPVALLSRPPRSVRKLMNHLSLMS